MKKTPKKYVGSSPMKLPVWAPAAISAGVGLLGAISGRKQEKRATRDRRAAEAAAAPYLQSYKDFEYKNPYENMENVYEDMRVNTQAAEFEKQQLAQQQADILQGLRGAAGGAGVAALAQSMARQGAIQAQRTSADISRQEQDIQRQQLQEQSRIQQLQRYGEQTVAEQEMQRNMNLYSLEAGKAGLASERMTAGQQQMMGGIGNIASAGLQAYGAGMFGGGGQPSTSNLEFAPGGEPPAYTTPDPFTSPASGQYSNVNYNNTTFLESGGLDGDPKTPY